ncbi:DUF3074 domain protein [Metarhizium robertsii]|uniref:START-like domain protein n=2 Tax=Metarhizium robertsii TaxID=568076 RepID=E9EVK1_METRA|nr:START-like domain protein [Metarhizium robertsii ARSEF 23]EFZ00273.1 START-like domain protein [Metarhizium robertsii ARSEF 23]EXV02737.1 DUF3074 domain protein [Metarhizium robertsii]
MEFRLPKLSADSDGDIKADHSRLIRLWGVEPSQLPSSASPPSDLLPLLTATWTEAVYFISKVHLESKTKTSPWHPIGVKRFPNSNAPVHLYQRVVSTPELVRVCEEHKINNTEERDLQPEVWALRRSVHQNTAATGTANWSEWVRCFKDNHAKAEKDFTPTVLNTCLMKKWKCKDIKIQLAGRTWVDWSMKWEESVHKLPFPLSKRVFPVLQVTAMTHNKQEFMVVQIAVKDHDATPRNGAVLGAYTSVERFRQTDGGVEWIMGTVSDARGLLPRWIQKRAVPAQIAKDVDMFLGWIAEERKRVPATDDDTPTPVTASGADAGTTSQVDSAHDMNNAPPRPTVTDEKPEGE